MRTIYGLCLAILALAPSADEYAALLARLREEDLATYGKVVLLDRETGLQFLRARYGEGTGKQPPASPPARDGGGRATSTERAAFITGPASERYEARARLRVGEATIEVADEGLGRIEIAGTPIRSAEGLRRFGRATYEGHDAGTVRWNDATTVFEPVDETFGGVRFRGFKETWSLRASVPFRSVALRGTYELGGTIEDVVVNGGARGWPERPLLRRFALADAFAAGIGVAGKHAGTGFAFQHRADAALVQFFGVRSRDGRTVGDLLEQAKAAGDGRLDHFWELVFEPGTEIVLPPFWTLLLTGVEDAVSAWSTAHEFVRAKLHEEVGLPDPVPVPGIAWPVFSREEGFAARTERCLETSAREGFRLVLLDTVWRRAEGSPKNLVTGELAVAEEYGGTDGLRRLVEACHARGLEVVAWAPAGHLQGGSRFGDAPIFRAHPEWKAKGPRGEDLVFSTDLQWGEFHGPFRRYFEESLLRVVRETGLDGFWLDSFNLAGQLVCRNEGGPRPNADALLETVVNLRAGGARRLLAEGASVFAAYSNWGFKPPGPDFALFDGSTILANYPDPMIYVDRYFDTCAARAPWIVPFNLLYGGKATGPLHEQARARIRETNRLYDEHRARMIFRQRTDLGFEYRAEPGKGRIVWALGEGPLPGGGRAESGRVYELP